MLRFWLIFGSIVFVLVLMQVYLAGSVSEWLETLPVGGAARSGLRWLLLGALVYFNLSIPLRILIRAFPGRDFSVVKKLVVFPGTTWLITMIMMFVLYISRDAAAWVWRWMQEDPVDPMRRAFLQASGALGLGAPLVLTAYGALKTARDYRVQRLDLEFARLPRELDGFQIAQISDIHSGIYMEERHLQDVREIIDSLHPQVLAMTGDYVDSLAEEALPVARIFSGSRTDYGVYACMGNHDVFDDYNKVTAAMSEAGIHMLDNTHRKISVNGAELAIAGVGDAGRTYSYARLDEALQGVPAGTFKVLLSHRPNFFDRAQSAGVDLQLSGHTHGGQIALQVGPIPLNIVYLLEKYARGLYTTGDSKLYVNSGVGMVFAPIRIGIPPEITLITLRTQRQESVSNNAG